MNRPRKFLKPTLKITSLMWILREAPNKGALLHLFSRRHRDGLVGEGRTGGCLAHSGQEMVEFTLCIDAGKTVHRAATLDSGRADFRWLKELLDKASWESAFEGIGGPKCWVTFYKPFPKSAGTDNVNVLQVNEEGQKAVLTDQESPWGSQAAKNNITTY